jgi:hypothetical protein
LNALVGEYAAKTDALEVKEDLQVENKKINSLSPSRVVSLFLLFL